MRGRFDFLPKLAQLQKERDTGSLWLRASAGGSGNDLMCPRQVRGQPGTHHGRDVLMVVLEGEAFLHVDGGQGFQDRGAQVKHGSYAVIGCVLWVRKGGHQRGGVL
jgi:mannose-6-phosphate isomerase-like protein (cupin superfamily)